MLCYQLSNKTPNTSDSNWRSLTSKMEGFHFPAVAMKVTLIGLFGPWLQDQHMHCFTTKWLFNKCGKKITRHLENPCLDPKEEGDGLPGRVVKSSGKPLFSARHVRGNDRGHLHSTQAPESFPDKIVCLSINFRKPLYSNAQWCVSPKIKVGRSNTGDLGIVLKESCLRLRLLSPSQATWKAVMGTTGRAGFPDLGGKDQKPKLQGGCYQHQR